MCQMIFEIQGKTDNYVRLVQDGTEGEAIKFLANKQLVEYEIQKVVLTTTSVCFLNKSSFPDVDSLL